MRVRMRIYIRMIKRGFKPKPPVHVRILASAGTLSPASNCRMSPGTSSSARMLTGAPSLTTLHL